MKPLEKLEQFHSAGITLEIGYGDDSAKKTIKGLVGSKFAVEILEATNAAIDRINFQQTYIENLEERIHQLEAKYEVHYHEHDLMNESLELISQGTSGPIYDEEATK